MIQWAFWVDGWQHPFALGLTRRFNPLPPSAELTPDEFVPPPSAPAPIIPDKKPKPPSKSPEDSFGYMDAGPITQWWKPQGGSVTILEPEMIDPHPLLSMPTDAEILEMGVKYLLIRSPIPTIPTWVFTLAPEEEITYH